MAINAMKHPWANQIQHEKTAVQPVLHVQGPYSRQAIKDWHESGFFPLDLPLSRTRERPQFHTLQELLQVWRAAGQPGPPPRQPVPLLPQPAQQPAAPQPAPADSLLAQQGSMQVCPPNRG